jgi:predicted MFS family arabinose efflux permease
MNGVSIHVQKRRQTYDVNNMSKETTPIGQRIGKSFLPSLFLSRFTTQPPTALLSLLLIEIGLTFGLEVGIVGQISAANSLVALVASFIVGAISVRFSHKRLLMTGLLLQTLSAVACAVSTSFNSLLLFFSLNGIGVALIMPMTMSITAEHLQREERANAIGWIIISIPASSIFISLAINLANFSSWRLPFLAILLPINVLSLLFVTIGVPALQKSAQLKDVNIFQGFTETIADKSAIACLIGAVFSPMSIVGFLVYHASFFRQTYQVSMGFVSLMFIGNWLCMAIGSRIAGHLMRRVGCRRLWALAMTTSGISTVLALVVPNVWISLTMTLLVFIQYGLAFTSASNLALDQIPSFRGTFMALFTAVNYLGATLGASLGGMILLWSNYETLGLFLGPIGLLAAIIVYRWAHERI